MAPDGLDQSKLKQDAVPARKPACGALLLVEIIEKLDAVLALVAKPEQRFFTTAQASEYAGLSEKSIRRLIAAGKLTALRPVGGRVLIDRRELDSTILAANRRPRQGRGFGASK